MSQIDIAVSDRPGDSRAVWGGIIVLVLAFGGFFGWSALAPLSSAAVAPGEVQVEGHRKTVEHLESGIISRILVKNGDPVRKGQILAQLDPTQARADRDMLAAQRDTLLATEARLMAQRDHRPAISWPPALTDRSKDAAVHAIMAGQAAIFDGDRSVLETETAVLRSKVDQLHAEIAGRMSQIRALDEQRRLVGENVQNKKLLVDKGLEPKPHLLEIEGDAARLDSERAQAVASRAEAEQSIDEAELQILKLRRGEETDASKELRDADEKLSNVTERLRQAEDVLSRTDIVAPASGVVMNLRRFTPGGVLKGGVPLLDIVPQRDPLVIRCRIDPKDIAAVHPGLRAQIRLQSDELRRTPVLHGRLIKISADTLADEKTGATFYEAEARVDPDQLAATPEVRLRPGMRAEVMIVTGKKSLLQYVLDPVKNGYWRAFREK